MDVPLLEGVLPMSILQPVPESDAVGLTAQIYAEDIQELGYVPDYTKTMALNTEALHAFKALAGAIVGQLGKRRYELVTLAAAGALRSTHCRLAHGVKILKLVDEEQLIRIARDYHDAGLSEAEVAMMEFAEKVSSDSAAMTEADSLRLRDAGFSDREILDITLAAAVRNYFSRALQALAVELDVPPVLGEQLRDALVARL
jgi:uncharacterized peroxidase-related enzyme